MFRLRFHNAHNALVLRLDERVPFVRQSHGTEVSVFFWKHVSKVLATDGLPFGSMARNGVNQLAVMSVGPVQFATVRVTKRSSACVSESVPFRVILG